VFGGTYWLYGYMLLYIYYGMILTLSIGKKRFPFEEAYHDINLDNISKRRHRIDLTRIPEFIFGTITALFVILFVILIAINPNQETVPTPSLKVGKTEYRFYLMGIFTIVLVATIFCIYCTYRLFKRKKKGI
jgi:hypothetical protein